MVFNLSIQCDSVQDLKESIRELMGEPRFESNCVGCLSIGKVFDYEFVDTNNVFNRLHGDVMLIKPEQ